MKLPRVRSRETKTGPTVRKRGGFGDDDDDDDDDADDDDDDDDDETCKGDGFH